MLLSAPLSNSGNQYNYYNQRLAASPEARLGSWQHIHPPRTRTLTALDKAFQGNHTGGAKMGGSTEASPTQGPTVPWARVSPKGSRDRAPTRWTEIRARSQQKARPTELWMSCEAGRQNHRTGLQWPEPKAPRSQGEGGRRSPPSAGAWRLSSRPPSGRSGRGLSQVSEPATQQVPGDTPGGGEGGSDRAIKDRTSSPEPRRSHPRHRRCQEETGARRHRSGTSAVAQRVRLCLGAAPHRTLPGPSPRGSASDPAPC